MLQPPGRGLPANRQPEEHALSRIPMPLTPVWLFAVALAFSATSCSSPSAPVASRPPPSQTLQPAGLQTARVAFAQGRYDEAYSGFEALLNGQPSDALRMEALYHLAVIELIRDPEARNFSRARNRLGEVKVQSDYRQGEVEALLELLVTLEDTRASYRRQGEELRAQEQALEQKEEALRSVTETLIGDQ